MAKGVIAKKQVFSLLMILVLVLFLVLATVPIVQATGGTMMEPAPNTPVNPASSGIDDSLLGLLFSIISLLL